MLTLYRLKATGTKGENTMLRIYAAKYLKEINVLLGLLPSDMLLLLKTNDCLRHLDASLGTPINTTLVITETVADVILREDCSSWWRRWWVGEKVSTKRTDGNNSSLSVGNIPQMTAELGEIATTYSSLLSRAIGLTVFGTFLKAVESWWSS
jgi:hypothetical protein